MENDVTEATIKGVMPNSNGCAIFLGPKDKTIVIYVDLSIGNAISMTINEVKKPRPLTHDLIGHIFSGLGVELDRVVVNDMEDGTYYARIILKMENELGKKIIELDSMVLALQAKKPIFITRKVLDASDDMTEILERILKQQN